MRLSSPVYWLTAGLLIVFGMVAIFSIGAPFFLAGLALVVAGPWRTRPGVVRTALAAVIGFSVGYVLIAPLSCTTTPFFGEVSWFTECSSVLGLPYRRDGLYNPPLTPALIAGVAVAAASGALAYRSRRTHRPDRVGATT